MTTTTPNANETTRQLCDRSFCRLALYGSVNGRVYEVRVSRTKTRFECQWSRRVEDRNAAWTGGRKTGFPTEAAALAFAATKIEAMREWAAS